MTFEEFIMQAREMNASDIHLTVGAPTVVRVNGELRKYTELSDQVVNRTILSILSAEQEKMLTEGKDIDFSFELKNGARQRVNVFRQSGKLAACIRLLNAEIPTLEELKMPPVLLEFAKKRRGLVLVTGPTGAGKSTTLAALMEYINRKFCGSSFRPIWLTTRPLMGNAEIPAAPIMGLIFFSLGRNRLMNLANTTPPTVSKMKATRPRPRIIRVCQDTKS